MNQNNQFPMPLMLLSQQPQTMQQVQQEEEPVRVRIAMELLNQFTFKTMDRIAINEVAVQTVDGQKLTTGESNLQATACNFLNDYLLGRVKKDRYERSKEEKQECNLPDTDEPGTLIRCFNCIINNPSADCIFCRGSGSVIVYPNMGYGG